MLPQELIRQILVESQSEGPDYSTLQSASLASHAFYGAARDLFFAHVIVTGSRVPALLASESFATYANRTKKLEIARTEVTGCNISRRIEQHYRGKNKLEPLTRPQLLRLYAMVPNIRHLAFRQVAANHLCFCPDGIENLDSLQFADCLDPNTGFASALTPRCLNVDHLIYDGRGMSSSLFLFLAVVTHLTLGSTEDGATLLELRRLTPPRLKKITLTPPWLTWSSIPYCIPDNLVHLEIQLSTDNTEWFESDDQVLEYYKAYSSPSLDRPPTKFDGGWAYGPLIVEDSDDNAYESTDSDSDEEDATGSDFELTPPMRTERVENIIQRRLDQEMCLPDGFTVLMATFAAALTLGQFQSLERLTFRGFDSSLASSLPLHVSAAVHARVEVEFE